MVVIKLYYHYGLLLLWNIFSYVSSLLLFHKNNTVEVSPDYQNQFAVNTPPQSTIPSNSSYKNTGSI